MMDSNKMDRIQLEIGIWGSDTFGHQADPEGSLVAIVNHMEKELVELRDALSVGSISEECADIFILMCSVAHVHGFSLKDAVRSKMEINRKREWGEPDSDEVIEHVATTPTGESE